MKINDGRLKGYIKQAETNGADANTIKGLAEFSNDLNQVLKRDLKPNLNSDVLKGNNFVTYPNSAKQTTTVNQSFNVKEWVKNMSGVINDEWIANLTKLANKHPEMFKSEADVFRVIKEIKDNPTHFFKNYDDEVSLIGKQLDNEDKFANIGVVKDTGEIIHTNKNKSKDLVRLQRRNNEMLTGTPLPATTQSKTPMEGDLLQHSDTDIIPQSTSKKQILQSAKSKIANKEELNLEEKKALVEERRAEIKAKKEAKQKAEQEDKTSVINEKSVDNLPNLGKNEQNTPKISTNLADNEIQAITDLSSQIDELKALRKNGEYPDTQIKQDVIAKSNELGKMLEARISSGKPVNKQLAKEYKHQIERAREERFNQSNAVKESNLGKTFDDNSIQDIVKNLASNKELAVELKPNNSILQTVNDFKKPIKTPLFESKINLDILFNHLSDKNSENRLKYINLVKPTLENPLFIAKNGDRYEFVKTFLDDDKVIKYLSVIENDKGDIIGITAMPIRNTDLKNKLKGNIILGGDTLSTLSTPQVAKQGVEAMSSIIPQFAKDYNLDDFKWDNGLKPKKAATKETVKQIRNIQAKFKALSPKQKIEIRKYLIDKS
ncbi:PBECR2 nuclease fold domain-containing protein [Campylobacter fetus]|uniref:PBECR2 nuclease fold domain-containing protein n=1 Tax=Campylobacter fetus TaxID=196 RepID=UPI000FC9F729|nr:PBECR2 nuclease fold domain-containing protein [Campylobacter fetus]RUT51345.1 hypothetical protein BWK67_02155 [Campylobacter fetus]RUT52074.1 hypothetical protein BWK51_02160 [Campylobacter fetus]